MYQFAMYVGAVRDLIRPGVLWFVKDPNDPEFQAMREILRRPVRSQIRKIFVGVVIYGFLFLSVIGGGIQILVVWDNTVKNWGDTWNCFRMFPLKIEYLDRFGFNSCSFSEIPFDMFFFNYVLPPVWKYMQLESKFKSVLKSWFSTVGRHLRISHFLLGEEKFEEESDDEKEEDIDEPIDDGRIRYLTVNNTRRRRRQPMFVATELHVDEEWEEIIDEHQSKKRRIMRFLRVPKIDNIEPIPGEKLMVWMKETDPVFGRPFESPEQVQRKWMKVYAPEGVFGRVFPCFYFSCILL